MSAADLANAVPLPSARQLGFWMCVALVIGNIIGSGIFMMPASLAPYGMNATWAWLATGAGAVALALVFAGLGRAFPEAGGPYAYTRKAFGELPAFVVIWTYWISLWVGNAAIATGGVSYLSKLFPWIADVHGASALVTVGFVIVLTGVNIIGARSAGRLQVVTTALKIIPLLAITGLGLWLVATGNPQLHNAHLTATPFRADAITAAAILILFTLCGLESAAVAADKIRDPARTIPRATIVGTVVCALVYIVACSTVMALIPGATLAQSNAPFADAAAIFWGPAVAKWLAAFAAISALGALNGWILLCGELPFQLAKNGQFPRAFARESARRTPTFSLVVSSAIVCALVLMNYGESMVSVFNFLVVLSTSATLVMYFVCALAALKLVRNGSVPTGPGTKWLAGAAIVGAAFALWAIIGAGFSTGPKACGTALLCWAPWKENALYLGAVLLALAIPVYIAMRPRNGQPRQSVD